MLHHHIPGWVIPAVAGLAILASANAAQAQQGQSLTIPSSELLRLDADVPAEVRAGEQFRYRVTVSNQSDSVALHNVQLEQKPSRSVSIDSATIQGGQQKRGQQSRNSWTIDQLEPGESRTIEVQATANKQGQADTCFLITSYTPALCATTKVVQPALELTKNAPERINICEPLLYEYIVRNPGTGDLTAFTVRDQLPEGILTESGDKNLEFRLEDGLEAGETRKFLAKLVATRAGAFSSRAIATAASGELETRSRAPETTVVRADLAVAIDGQQQVYGRQTVGYTARITNTGNAPADGVVVRLMLPDEARVVAVGDFRFTENAVRQAGQQGQPTPANFREADGRGQAAGDEIAGDEPFADDSLQMVSGDMVVDQLEPGQTVEFDFAVRPNGLEEIKAVVVALNRCVIDREVVDSELAVVRSVALVTTRVVLLPDLLVSLVDNEGTVPQGGELTYFLIVRNQGDAPADNVQATVELPQELQYVAADGPTESEVSGRKLAFGALEQLPPGEQVRWTILTEATGAGEVRVKANVNAGYLEKPVETEEPTVVYSEENIPEVGNQ